MIYFIKFILIPMFMLFIYSINTTAQEINEITPLNLDKNVSGIKNSENEFLKSALNLQLENSLLTSKSYMINKVNYTNFSVINLNHLSFFSASSDYNYGFEGATSVSFGANWKMSDKLTFTGNPFLTSYYFGPMGNNRNMSVGGKAILTYEVTDWLTLRTFGQYAYNGLNDPYATSLIVPQNSFGGEVQVKFSEVFGLGGGIKYAYNMGRWKPQFYTLPIIKINAAKILKRD